MDLTDGSPLHSSRIYNNTIHSDLARVRSVNRTFALFSRPTATILPLPLTYHLLTLPLQHTIRILLRIHTSHIFPNLPLLTFERDHNLSELLSTITSLTSPPSPAHSLTPNHVVAFHLLIGTHHFVSLTFSPAPLATSSIASPVSSVLLCTSAKREAVWLTGLRNTSETLELRHFHSASHLFQHPSCLVCPCTCVIRTPVFAANSN